MYNFFSFLALGISHEAPFLPLTWRHACITTTTFTTMGAQNSVFDFFQGLHNLICIHESPEPALFCELEVLPLLVLKTIAFPEPDLF